MGPRAKVIVRIDRITLDAGPRAGADLAAFEVDFRESLLTTLSSHVRAAQSGRCDLPQPRTAARDCLALGTDGSRESLAGTLGRSIASHVWQAPGSGGRGR